ncbi:MAG: GGDEF domain-containing protein [Campylobacterota bacterium]|nr:GGDEF domain-containing protein [Campylobacterota bacterium]
MTIFNKLAKLHALDLEEEELQANKALDDKLEEILSIDEIATKKVDQLDKSTKKAVSAIVDKNENLLNETLSETQALRLEIEALKCSLYKDALTKVYNRKWLNVEVLDKDEKFIHNGFIYLADMNYFKYINDTYGHIAGDKVLVYVSNHLQKLDADIVRYGGDEFLVIFNDKSEADVSNNMNLNRETLLKKQLKFHQHKFSTSYSYGGLAFHHGDTFAELIEQADVLMYEDKEKIKQRVKPK